jgi:hypothetical protein
MMKFLSALKGIIVEAQFGPDYTMSSTIRPLLRQIYTGNGYKIPPGTQWSTVQAVYPEFSDVCQTKEGVIGPKELAHPGEEKYNWSIINRFDTNSMVHSKIKELHAQSGDEDNVYTWVKNNAEDLFTPGGRYINELVRANLQTYLKGEARERQAIKILSDKLPNITLQKFCSGAEEDFSKGKDLIVTLPNGSSFSTQVKPFDTKMSRRWTDPEGTVYYRIKSSSYNPTQYKPTNVQVIMFVDEEQFIIFANERNRIVKDGRDYARFYEEPLITNFDFGIKKDTGSPQIKKVKQHFSYGTNKENEIERLELKKREIEKLIKKLSKVKNK